MLEVATIVNSDVFANFNYSLTGTATLINLCSLIINNDYQKNDYTNTHKLASSIIMTVILRILCKSHRLQLIPDTSHPCMSNNGN